MGVNSQTPAASPRRREELTLGSARSWGGGGVSHSELIKNKS